MIMDNPKEDLEDVYRSSTLSYIEENGDEDVIENSKKGLTKIIVLTNFSDAAHSFNTE